jgi:predicted DNA-binding transcriptional regulator AlpA
LRFNAVSDKPETVANVGANDIFDKLRNHEKLLTVKELAGILSISQKTIYSYVGRNMIPYVKIESNVGFRPNTSLRGSVTETSIFRDWYLSRCP